MLKWRPQRCHLGFINSLKPIPEPLEGLLSSWSVRFQQVNFANKRSIWVPYAHPLPQNAQRRVGVAKILLEMENRRSFLDVLVTL